MLPARRLFLLFLLLRLARFLKEGVFFRVPLLVGVPVVGSTFVEAVDELRLRVLLSPSTAVVSLAGPSLGPLLRGKDESAADIAPTVAGLSYGEIALPTRRRGNLHNGEDRKGTTRSKECGI